MSRLCFFRVMSVSRVFRDDIAKEQEESPSITIKVICAIRFSFFSYAGSPIRKKLQRSVYAKIRDLFRLVFRPSVAFFRRPLSPYADDVAVKRFPLKIYNASVRWDWLCLYVCMRWDIDDTSTWEGVKDSERDDEGKYTNKTSIRQTQYWNHTHSQSQHRYFGMRLVTSFVSHMSWLMDSAFGANYKLLELFLRLTSSREIQNRFRLYWHFSCPPPWKKYCQRGPFFHAKWTAEIKKQKKDLFWRPFFVTVADAFHSFGHKGNYSSRAKAKQKRQLCQYPGQRKKKLKKLRQRLQAKHNKTTQYIYYRILQRKKYHYLWNRSCCILRRLGRPTHQSSYYRPKKIEKRTLLSPQKIRV